MMRIRQERPSMTRALAEVLPESATSGMSMVADSAGLGKGSFARLAAAPANVAKAAPANSAKGNKCTTSHTYRTFWNVRHLGQSGAPPGEKPRIATHFTAPEAAGNPGGFFVSRTTFLLDSVLNPSLSLETQP